MTTFLILAALMAALASAAVAVPLCRHPQSRIVGVVAGLALAGAAAALYPLWSNWNWHAAAAGAAANVDVLGMVAKLEAHLKDNPQDAAGWVMLGRSYMALERRDDAILAYDHAHRLDLSNVEATLGLGEAMSLRAGGTVTAAAAELFEQAMALEPANPKALLYGGFAAAARGDTAAARARWQALKDMHPPAQIEQLLDARIAELGTTSASPAAGGVAGAAGAAGAGGDTGAAVAGGTAAVASAAGAAGTDVTINISIAPALKSRISGQAAPLFIYAREPGMQGSMPLAAKRLTTAAIGTQIHMSAADAMIAGRALKSGQPVSITARVSFSGQPLAVAGDLYGELTYDVGHDGARDLVIDRVAE